MRLLPPAAGPMSEDERRSTVSRISDAKRLQMVDGQHIFREHESGDAAYVVLEGQVTIYRAGERGDEVLATLGKGAMFGEMALIDNQVRMASAKSIGNSLILVVTRDAFLKRMSSLDPFTRGLIKILAENIRTIQNT
jgi:CRP/FNR family transcriptional regulator, cyclic AMP receptor protein